MLLDLLVCQCPRHEIGIASVLCTRQVMTAASAAGAELGTSSWDSANEGCSTGVSQRDQRRVAAAGTGAAAGAPPPQVAPPPPPAAMGCGVATSSGSPTFTSSSLASPAATTCYGFGGQPAAAAAHAGSPVATQGHPGRAIHARSPPSADVPGPSSLHMQQQQPQAPGPAGTTAPGPGQPAAAVAQQPGWGLLPCPTQQQQQQQQQEQQQPGGWQASGSEAPLSPIRPSAPALLAAPQRQQLLQPHPASSPAALLPSPGQTNQPQRQQQGGQRALVAAAAAAAAADPCSSNSSSGRSGSGSSGGRPPCMPSGVHNRPDLERTQRGGRGGDSPLQAAAAAAAPQRSASCDVSQPPGGTGPRDQDRPATTAAAAAMGGGLLGGAQASPAGGAGRAPKPPRPAAGLLGARSPARQGWGWGLLRSPRSGAAGAAKRLAFSRQVRAGRVQGGLLHRCRAGRAAGLAAAEAAGAVDAASVLGAAVRAQAWLAAACPARPAPWLALQSLLIRPERVRACHSQLGLPARSPSAPHPAPLPPIHCACAAAGPGAVAQPQAQPARGGRHRGGGLPLLVRQRALRRPQQAVLRHRVHSGRPAV
jgi:hypothetical protein